MAAPLVGAALLVAAFGAACSGSSTPTPTPSSPSSSASPAATDPDAAKALQQAVTATHAVRQLSFTASTTVVANQTVHTTLSGRVIRGKGIAYRLTVGKKKTQVIRVHSGTYVRQVPGKWSKLAKPKALVNPTSTLLALLRGMTPTGVSHPSGNTRVDGVLPASAAKSVGIPSTGSPAHAVVLIDRHGHVIAVTLRGAATVGSKMVHVSVISRYAHFGHVQPIKRP